MALPGPGVPLSINMIRNELGSSSGSLRALSALAGFSTPDSISEFYGYSPPATCGLINVGYNLTNRDTACSNFNFGTQIPVYASPPNLQTATLLYRTACGGAFRGAGYYSDGVKTRYWNGTAFTTTFDCIV